MLEITFLSLFPNYFKPLVEESIINKAIAKKLVTIKTINWRNYTQDKQKRVDDLVYGGGGMLLKLEPLVAALENLKGYKILVSPQGKVFEHKMAQQLAQKKEPLIFIAGRYEGFDERILNYVDTEISLGDFVLSGGELAAAAMADAIIRLYPGVINPQSLENESFSKTLLDFPQYTRPAQFRNYQVPPILRSGNHAQIAAWRKKAAEIKTLKNRPDLYERYKNEK